MAPDYRRVGKTQLDALVALRLKVLRAANKLPDDAELPEIEKNSRSYYEKAFEADSFAVYFAYDGDRVVACGGVSFFEIMPTCDFPNGKCAYIMNMYTEPEYRGMGIATHILELLVEECRARGVRKITLEATEAGRGVYARYGFVPMEHEMGLPSGE